MKDHFRTIVRPTKSSFTLNHQDAFLLMGSCFSQTIGDKLSSVKFDVLSNPLGICYNPISIHNLIKSTGDITVSEQNAIYFSHELHSTFNALNNSDVKRKFEQQLKNQQEQLSKKGILFITYGTAWVYELKTTRKIVNNCHKQPANLFTKRLLSVTEIVDSFQETMEYLSANFPQKEIVFTVSPVRHIKDGIRENQLSKSILHLAANAIGEKYESCSYFPSYEIMLDDLRDYRFYSSDLIHPNQTAIDYIWQYFSEFYFSKETQELVKEITQVNNSVRHRPFLPEHDSHQKFLQQLLIKVQQLEINEALDFSQEIDLIKQQLSSSN